MAGTISGIYGKQLKGIAWYELWCNCMVVEISVLLWFDIEAAFVQTPLKPKLFQHQSTKFPKP